MKRLLPNYITSGRWYATREPVHLPYILLLVFSPSSPFYLSLFSLSLFISKAALSAVTTLPVRKSWRKSSLHELGRISLPNIFGLCTGRVLREFLDKEKKTCACDLLRVHVWETLKLNTADILYMLVISKSTIRRHQISSSDCYYLFVSNASWCTRIQGIPF